MCDCNVCVAHREYMVEHKGWPDADPVKLARYITSKRTGKIPADPAYAAHRRATLSWGAGRRSEFSQVELTSKTVKVYQAPPRKEIDRQFPGLEFLGSTGEYVAEFERLNNLVLTSIKV